MADPRISFGSQGARDEAGEAYLGYRLAAIQEEPAAYWSLWLLVPIFLLAIFAPLIASNVPLVFHDGQQTTSPWLRGLMNPRERRLRLQHGAAWFLPLGPHCTRDQLVLPTSGVVGRDPGWASWRWGTGNHRRVVRAVRRPAPVIGLRPQNPDQDRNFPKEQFLSGGTKYGIYPPIPFGPTEIDLDARFQPPLFRKPADRWTEANDGFIHLLGTDKTGRDVLVQMLFGTRISMTVGLVAVGIYLAIGIVAGALAGYFGGKTDMLISRVIEVVMLFPSLFLILTLVALIGRSVYIIMIVIGITGWPSIARLVRGEVLKQRAIEYTLAARALGSSSLRIVFRHILPNALSPVLVAAPFGIASAIITEATLSLLGFGVEPPTPTWGMLLHQGHNNYHNWWLILVPVDRNLSGRHALQSRRQRTARRDGPETAGIIVTALHRQLLP